MSGAGDASIFVVCLADRPDWVSVTTGAPYDSGIPLLSVSPDEEMAYPLFDGAAAAQAYIRETWPACAPMLAVRPYRIVPAPGVAVCA